MGLTIIQVHPFSDTELRAYMNLSENDKLRYQTRLKDRFGWNKVLCN